MAARTYSARVVKFRKSVYLNHGNVTPAVQVLLLRLSEDMNANAIVSIPRARLADEFGCDPARITERMNKARDAGYLSIVRRARQHVTAVYQGLYVGPEVRHSAPLSTDPEVRSYAPDGVRHSAPQTNGQRCALAHTQEVVDA
ncbi:hypothetical protein BH11ACT8_BH11ACT8_04360 [soil metagenome]